MPHKKWLAPVLLYLIVWAGLFLFENAWITLVGFHIAILLLFVTLRASFPLQYLFKSSHPKWILFSILFCSASGVGLYFLWGVFEVSQDLPAQLGILGLNSTSWIPFIAYFSLVNPFVEEYFWRGVLGSAAKGIDASDLLYAGYHAIILWGRVSTFSVLFAVIILISAGWLWRQLSRVDDGLFSAVLGHMAADFSILFVIYMMTR